MYTLTDDEKAYLRIAYNNGYRWIAANEDCFVYFYDAKPEKIKGCLGYWSGNIASESLIEFGTSWDDEEPTEIAKLLGVVGCETKPLTPVFVRDYDSDEWTKAYFYK